MLNQLKKEGYIYNDSEKRAGLLVHNPATGEHLATVKDFHAADTEIAIQKASQAFHLWRGYLASERSKILRRWHGLILEHTEPLAQLLTQEQGKPLAEARSEVSYGASFIEYYAEEAKRVEGDILASHRSDARPLVLKQPVGVVAAITPWNFPIAMITRKVAPALAAGCTVICKPAEETPLSALALALLGKQAGLPHDIFTVVTTTRPAEVGKVLTASPLVRALSFTGSTEVGKLLFAQCASTVKKVALELGGNAPFIVFDDADLAAAVEGALVAKFRNTGQTCICANRLFIHDSLYERFAALLKEKAASLIVGNGSDPGVTQGPLVNQAALNKVETHIADAVSKGAKVLIGGKSHACGGTFYEPTILTDVTPDMHVALEETFGPVAPLIRFQSEEEVIELANRTSYGLAGYFYARDIGRIWRVAEALEYGMIGVNCGVISTEIAPFGGVKESGIGREGSHYGLDEYLELKYVLLGGLV